MPRFLVTAGNTREMIDRVRDWGNVFTGNTGFAIAEAIAAHGEVDLLTSNAAHAAGAADAGIRATVFRSHADLNGLLEQCMTPDAYAAIFMTAAVADYRPVGAFTVTDRIANADGSETWTVKNAGAGKVKSDHPAVAFLGERTAKLVDRFRRDWGHRGLLVKFKLEVGLDTDALLAIAEKSRQASGADYLVANTLDMVTGDGAGAYLLSDSGHEWISRGGLAARCATLAATVK